MKNDEELNTSTVTIANGGVLEILTEVLILSETLRSPRNMKVSSVSPLEVAGAWPLLGHLPRL